MSFLYGIIGAVAAILLFLGGAFAGYAVRGMRLPKTPEPKQETPEEIEKRRLERKRLIEQQQAFNLVQNYSVERAYGMLDEPDFRGKRSDST